MKEAEVQYRQCVTDANAHQEDLEKVKEKIIAHIRKLIQQGDTVLKEVSVARGAGAQVRGARGARSWPGEPWHGRTCEFSHLGVTSTVHRKACRSPDTVEKFI